MAQVEMNINASVSDALAAMIADDDGMPSAPEELEQETGKCPICHTTGPLFLGTCDKAGECYRRFMESMGETVTDEDVTDAKSMVELMRIQVVLEILFTPLIDSEGSFFV